MKNQEVINLFVVGAVKGKTKNLKIEGDKLINYYTVIAVRKHDHVLLNNNKYSATTSRIQNMIRNIAPVVVEISEQDIKKAV